MSSRTTESASRHRRGAERTRRATTRALVPLAVLTSLTMLGCTAAQPSAPPRSPASRAAGSQPSPLSEPLQVTVVKPTTMAVLSLSRRSTIKTSSDVVVSQNSGGAVRDSQETVLLFPLPSGCVEHADLDLGTSDGTLPAGAVNVYTSGLARSAVDATATPRVMQSTETILDNRPRGELRVVDGRVHVDVTDIARRWQAGGPYGRLGSYVRQGSPLGLEVMPASLAEPRFSVRFSDSALTLRARTDRPCVYAGPNGTFAPSGN